MYLLRDRRISHTKQNVVLQWNKAPVLAWYYRRVWWSTKRCQEYCSKFRLSLVLVLLLIAVYRSGCLQFETTGLNLQGDYSLLVSNVHGSANKTLTVRFHQQHNSLEEFSHFDPGIQGLPGLPPSLYLPFPLSPNSVHEKNESRNSSSSVEGTVESLHHTVNREEIVGEAISKSVFFLNSFWYTINSCCYANHKI